MVPPVVMVGQGTTVTVVIALVVKHPLELVILQK